MAEQSTVKTSSMDDAISDRLTPNLKYVQGDCYTVLRSMP